MRKCYQNITEKHLSYLPYPIPHLVWDLYEKVSKLPDLTDKMFFVRWEMQLHFGLACEHSSIFKSRSSSRSAVRSQKS